nr:RDD family protein [Microbulbifer zhoushanensis]
MDTRYTIETPEGIDLQAQVAGPVPRVLAYAVDLFYRTVITIALWLGLNLAGMDTAGWGIWLLGSFLLEWFYPVVFELWRHGQTPGKQAFGLMVVNANLTPVSWSASLLRNLLRVADFLPLAYATGLTTMTLSRQFQRLGDMAADTIVVYRQPQADRKALPQLAPCVPPRNLEAEDQRAIISLTERHREISEARQEELAELLQPVTDASGPAGLRYLRAIGLWLLGAR